MELAETHFLISLIQEKTLEKFKKITTYFFEKSRKEPGENHPVKIFHDETFFLKSLKKKKNWLEDILQFHYQVKKILN